MRQATRQPSRSCCRRRQSLAGSQAGEPFTDALMRDTLTGVNLRFGFGVETCLKGHIRLNIEDRLGIAVSH